MAKKTINVLIDARFITAHLGYTIMQTCSNAGVDIPRFCYHDKLLIAGNCRICLIEVIGSKKLVPACAVHVSDNMSIYTNTVRVRVARQNVLEFLLANHPLDCPICDQGGECDLQDITALFGADRGRFYENEKRAVLNKDFGPLIRTSMNRCIHCTRCVRFLALSSGFSLLGTLGRGLSTEISLYVNKFITDELSGNITDLCPVGALTSKPYSFKARPWELVSVQTIDVFDSLNSTLTVDIMANKICRVLPYANEILNECWLTNKARYAYDGLFIQRLNSCLLKITLTLFFGSRSVCKIKKLVSELFVKIPWSIAFKLFYKLLLTPELRGFKTFVGNASDLETTYLTREFVGLLGGNSFFFEHFRDIGPHNTDFTYLYTFNTSLLKLSKLPSFCLLVGTNLRFEIPLVNLRLTKLSAEYGVAVYKIGGSLNYSAYKTKLISNSLSVFYQICEFKHPFCKNFYLGSFSCQPFILSGGSTLVERSLGDAVVLFVRRILTVCNSNLALPILTETLLNSFSFLYQYSAQLHVFDAGLCSSVMKFSGGSYSAYVQNFASKNLNLFYAVGFTYFSKLILKRSNAKLIYQGSHGCISAASANLVLSTVTHAEKTGYYRNLLGGVQKSNIILSYGFEAKTDEMLLRALILSIDALFFKNFFGFTFKNGLLFNVSLLLATESTADHAAFYSEQLSAITLSSKNLSIFCKLSESLHYVKQYTNFLEKLNFKAFNTKLRLSVPSKISTSLISSNVINYYGDNSLIFLTTSKTMTLCSNLYLKKNFSFSSTYY